MGNCNALELLRAAAPTVSVGVVTANLLTLGTEIKLLEQTGAKLAHVDVMDGCFCPMMTVGPPFIKAIKTSLLKDVHLMISEPLEKVAEYVAVGADIVTVHVEACSNVHRVLQKLGSLTNANDPERGVVRGVALNPGTPLEALEPLLDELEFISLLAVNPGWGGQKYIPSTTARIARVKRMIAESGKNIILCADGGITKANIAEIAATGVDVIVAGSAVFDGKTPEANARFMLDAVAAVGRKQ
ncbi:MAG: ribulose-phosphate 3-epimerase [Acidobacteriota bacterium]|nr:ribulose-phosphate 3-epimerase [Acidobacteriota bacterium]